MGWRKAESEWKTLTEKKERDLSDPCVRSLSQKREMMPSHILECMLQKGTHCRSPKR